MDLEGFVASYDLDAVLAIEEQDTQFLVLADAWKRIRSTHGTDDRVQITFIFLVLQNALVSFQIAGSGPLWWGEFAEKLVLDFALLQERIFSGLYLVDRWYAFLTHSRYNKRLYNIKRTRLEKFSFFASDFLSIDRLFSFYNDMVGFTRFVATCMQQKATDKTIVFTTKMFGYACRIVFGERVLYPMDVGIPLDSRLRRIYLDHIGDDDAPATVLSFFSHVAEKHDIPPLHLDSLLWLEFWRLFYK